MLIRFVGYTTYFEKGHAGERAGPRATRALPRHGQGAGQTMTFCSTVKADDVFVAACNGTEVDAEPSRPAGGTTPVDGGCLAGKPGHQGTTDLPNVVFNRLGGHNYIADRQFVDQSASGARTDDESPPALPK